jgi:electron transfer flavoprotein beta subunit
VEIVVCIKQVPHPEYFGRITLDRDRKTIVRSGIPAITNPPDRHALEEALRIRERWGGAVTVLSMGPAEARSALEEALATGADRAALLCDPAFAGADSLATAHALAGAVRLLGTFDIVLCGNESADGATGQVPPQLAEFLHAPHATSVCRIVVRDEWSVGVESRIEGGRLSMELALPAVIAVRREINTYRLPTVMGIMEAAGKEIRDLRAGDLAAAGVGAHEVGVAGSPTRVADIFPAGRGRQVEMLTGDVKEAARKLIGKLRERDAL